MSCRGSTQKGAGPNRVAATVIATKAPSGHLKRAETLVVDSKLLWIVRY